MKTCEVCGKPLTTTHPKARYCGATCRQRARRGATSPVLAQLAPDSPLVSAVRAELDAGGRLDSYAGQAALALAGQVDAGRQTGAGYAALIKQLHATMGVAMEGAAKSADGVDELLARRMRRAVG